MTDERRCPECGALVAADAHWCGQCYANLDRAPAAKAAPAEAEREAGVVRLGPPPPGPEGGRAVAGPSVAIRREGEALLWACPRCGVENRMESAECQACGTPFATLLAAAPTGSDRELPEPRQALILSFALAGLGHMRLGRTADGIARLVLFLWALGLGIIMLASPKNSGPVVGVGALFVVAAIGVWIMSALDAYRLANGEEEQLLRPRILLVGTIALTMLSIGAFVAAGFGAANG